MYHEGQIVGNNYRIIRMLGKGGFGSVYLGEHIYLKQKVAIKILDKANQLTDKEKTNFLQEAQTIASLVHPNIVRIQNYGIDDDTKLPFLVMDYATNGTLRQHYPAGTPVPLKDIIPHVKQITSALEHAHQKKIIHRDVKPENLLLSHDNNILLSDFGLAIVAHNTASQHAVPFAGTLAYTAPEQCNGNPKPASDQYSLAVTVYEWICGFRPFNGTVPELLFQHLNAPPPPLRDKIPSIYPSVEEAVLKALNKDYKARFETITAFSDALEQAFLAQEAIVIETANATKDRAESSLVTLQVAEDSPPLGTLVRTYQTNHCYSFSKQVLAWSFDSTLLACGDNRGIVQVWDILEDKEVCKYQGHSHVTALLWSRDNRAIFSAGYEGTIQEWNVKTNRKIDTYKGHTDTVTSLALAPSGKYIASGSNDTTAMIWNIEAGKSYFTYKGHTTGIHSIAWSPNDTLIATADSGSVQVWDVSKKQEVFTSYSPTQSIAWSPNGDCIASANSQLHLWNPLTGLSIRSYSVKYPPLMLYKMFTWSPDGTKIACVVQDQVPLKGGGHRPVGKIIHIWEVKTGNCLFSYEGHSTQIEAIAWAPNGKYIASYSHDGTVHVWQAS